MEERILIVDDDITFALMLRTWLSKRGFGVGTASSVAAARTALEAGGFSLVLSDMRLPDEDGIALLQWMAGAGVAAPVIVMTSYAEIQNAVRCMKLGARDYVAKPVNPDELLKKIREALDVPAAPAAKSASKPAPRAAGSFSEQPLNYIEGRSDAARQLYEHIRLVAPTNMSVLVNGASGTGKEHVAQLIHRESKRAGKPFVAVDCGAIPRDLAASEFFGHVKGAFTGALADKTGAFEAADGGTLFLDEVGNLGYETQVQLLRALQERRIRPVGSNREIPVDIRLVAATNEDLEAAIARGTFRADLYHRINSFTLRMPCLRQMRGDIPLFADFFLDQANRELDKRIVGFDAAAAAALAAYDWPGNLRQLKNAVLLLASLFFYAWGEPKYMLLMLVSIVQGYGFGLLIEKHREQKASKVFLTLSILVSLGLLGYFKYADFFLSSVNAVAGLSLPLLKLSLPIGISFYTFQVLSYVIDVYRGETAAQRNFIDLAAYVSLFPQLIAGPIVRYSDVAAELKSRTHSVSAAAEGVRRFMVGFAKKILLANQFGALASVYKSTQDASVLFVWLYALAFLLQVYFDFSGYSDMAIGLGRMLGFHFPENFNYPYISASITEFWRRWHMSLGSWFRDYLYIPLGGSRKGKARQLLNILIVWLATGLWHGAAWTFVLWGLWFAVLLLLEKLALLPVLEKHRVLGHVYTLFFVTLGFVLFDADSAAQAVSRIGAMLGAGGLPLSSAQAVYYLKSYGPLLVLGILCATPLPKMIVAKLRKSKGAATVLDVLEPLFVLIPLLLGTAFLVDGSFNPFLYFRF